jgi:hypothetical protein
MCKKYDIPLHLRTALTAEEAAALTGLPVRLLRAEAYFARAKPKLSNFPAMWIGDKLMIPRQPLVTWVEQEGSRHRQFSLADAREITKVYGGEKV